MTSSDPSNPAARLLAGLATPALLRELVLDMPRPHLQRAIADLGRQRDAAAAQVLVAIDQLAADKVLRKAARRELHRLAGVGIHPAEVLELPAAVAAPTMSTPPVVPRDAWASEYDYTGARALWLLGDRQDLGSSWVAAFVLHDTRGVANVEVYDSTRKRFMRELDRMRRERPDSPWIDLPLPYALGLIRESADLTRAQDTPLPSAYKRFVELFGEPASAPERPLNYDVISPLEIRLHPEWLVESERLIMFPEVGAWAFEPSPELRRRALEIVRGTGSALLVPGNTPPEQTARLLADAVREQITPARRSGLRRRLEETAYIFTRTERLDAARRAAAAAQALEDSGVAPLDHPLIRMLVGAGLAASLRGERLGNASAMDVLLDLLGEIQQPAEAPGSAPAVAQRPSGLILPR